jgi:hypothetical protein
MKSSSFACALSVLVMVCASTSLPVGPARAQQFDFGQIDSFESLGSGTQVGGAPPKVIVDDGERHTVLFTVIESNTDAKIYWKSNDGEQTTIIKGPSVRAFQTIGTFRIEAAGDKNNSVKYGYVLLRLKSEKNATGDKI